jgi:hypothetical protein
MMSLMFLELSCVCMLLLGLKQEKKVALERLASEFGLRLPSSRQLWTYSCP